MRLFPSELFGTPGILRQQQNSKLSFQWQFVLQFNSHCWRNRRILKKMIPSWPAAFCFLNIVLAIFACVLVTHASILKNANELCLKPLTSDVKCSGIMASCKLEHSTLLAEYGLYVYALSMGISSVLMMFHSCCTKAR